MEVERLAVTLRTRSAWEAADLGFAMARRWWRPLYTAWFVLVAPPVLILNLVLHDRLWLAALLTWWLKPLFDRVPLHVASRAAFGEVPTLSEILRAVPTLLSTGVVGALTLYRLDPARSFNLPVWQLEGLRGGARARRARVLRKQGWGTGVWLTIACLHLEWALLMGLYLLVYLLIPVHLLPDLWQMLGVGGTSEAPWWLGALANGFGFLAVSVIEPCYVLAGFGLYLNRRTQLEAWDVELAFRRLARRLARAPAGGAAATAAVLTVVLLVAAPLDQGRAEMAPAEARPIIDEVLAQPAFDTHEEISYWAPIDEGDDAGAEADRDAVQQGPAWLGMVARVLRFALWLGAVAAVLYVVLNYRHLRHGLWRSPRPTRLAQPPTVIAGMDVAPQSLPDDVPRAAAERLAAGRAVEALGLLYRGAVVYWVHRAGLDVREGATEGECLRVVHGHAEPSGYGYFEQLTQAWQQAAYARRTPGHRTIEALCAHWDAHFGPSQGDPAS